MRLLLLALVLLVACSSKPTPECLCGGAPGVLEAPSSLDFGDVAVGNSETRKLLLTNEGAGDLDLLQSTIAGDAGTGSSLIDGGAVSLAPGQTTSWEVVFSPTAAGTFAAQLELPNDGDPDLATVQLTGTGVDLNCSCSPTALGFGTIPLGAPAQRTITCTNSAPSSCLVSLDVSNTSAVFIVTDANGPIVAGSAQTLTPDAGYTFSVGFDPSMLGNFSSTLAYTLCANPNVCVPPQPITLSGTAVPACAFTITPSPIAFSAATQAQAVTVTNTAPNAVYLPCISLDSLGATACGESSAAYAFSGLPALPSSLGPDAGLTFTLTATGAHGDDLLDVSCLPQGASAPTVFTAPITEGM